MGVLCCLACKKHRRLGFCFDDGAFVGGVGGGGLVYAGGGVEVGDFAQVGAGFFYFGGIVDFD